MKFIWHPLSIVVITARVAAALYMFVDPLRGYIWTVVFDYLDVIVFLHILRVRRVVYQYVDKILDFFYFGVMLVIGWQYSVFIPLAILFVYRLIGQIIFMKNHKVETFVFFLNFFEVLFIWAFLGAYVGFTNGMIARNTRIWLLVLFLVKEGQEISLHYIYPMYLRDNNRD